MTRTVEVRRGLYRDSVALMQMSHTVAGLPGVETALIAMATPLNLDLLPGLGSNPRPGPAPTIFWSPSAPTTTTRCRLRCAGSRSCSRRGSRRGQDGGGGAAAAHDAERIEAKRCPSGSCISVPGPNAFVEAMDTLHQDADVMLFSDNVSVDQEI